MTIDIVMGAKTKLVLLIAWFPSSLLTLFLSVILLRHVSTTREMNTLLKMQALQMLPKNGYEFYAALPEVLGSFTTAVEKEDARPEIIRQFLVRHDSPLTPFADVIVNAADLYNIDFRLTTAIAMCESNLGKKMPEGSYNAWGYAIYTGKMSGAEFEGWLHAIQVMTKYMAEKYYTKGLTTPEEIGPIYAPPSVNTGNSWARCVRTFMDDLK